MRRFTAGAHWGRIPRRRGPTLVIADHQHDLESMTIVSTTFVEWSFWRDAIFTAGSPRMYEPGFLATRFPWLGFLLRRVDAGPLFMALGLLPLENELDSRMEDLARRGATFYFTPEVRSCVDGTTGAVRGAIDRLAPLATVYLAGVSYDPFVSKRLSMLFRVGRLDDRARLTQALAALRPVVASQLLAKWLCTQGEPFLCEQAVAGVESHVRALPPQLFVDPELRARPGAKVRAALSRMVEWKILERDGISYRLAAERRHPQFPLVADIVEYNARSLEETVANASAADAVTVL